MSVKLYFCARLKAFYAQDIHLHIPEDVEEISEELHAELLEGQMNGYIIDFSSSPPSLSPREVQSTAVTERAWRYEQLSKTEWVVARHRDELDMKLVSTLTADHFDELLVYRQTLRKWPQDLAFPNAERRPVAPLWLTNLTQ